MKVFLVIIFIFNVFAASIVTANEDFSCKDGDNCKSTLMLQDSFIVTTGEVTPEESKQRQENSSEGSCSDCGCHSRHLFTPILLEAIKHTVPSRLSEADHGDLQQMTLQNYYIEINRPPIV